MTLRLSGHISIFGLDFFVFKSLLGILRQWSRETFSLLLLRLRANGRNNSQHCCANNGGSRYVRFGSGPFASSLTCRWELLHLFAHYCQHGLNNFQQCWELLSPLHAGAVLDIF